MPSTFELVNEIVEEALDRPLVERDSYVSARCGSDAPLFDAVRRLLASADSTVGFLDSPPALAPLIRPGDVLGGRFQILQVLGAGGMGTTFLADDRQLGKVALKVPHPEMRAHAGDMERFRAEVRIARELRHPNICPVFDLFTFDQAPGGPLAAITMQYLPGETLARRLEQGPIPPAEAMRIAKGIGAGLDAMHADGIIHRDLKPANIMLTATRDGSLLPVIMDFGLAGPASGSEMPVAITGSPHYMAPEQFRGAPPAPSADIYAFGLILFEMIAGARPFPAEDFLPSVIRRATEDAPRVSSVAWWAPRAWDCAIARALSRNVSARPRSAREVLQEMEIKTTSNEPRCAKRAFRRAPRTVFSKNPAPHRARSRHRAAESKHPPA